MKHEVWAADRFRFRVAGQAPQRFLSRAARQGVRLRRLQWQAGGFTAVAAGADYAKLFCLAREGGWTFTILQRRGPGRRLEALLARPGIAAGAALFLLLVYVGGTFVWSIDLDAVDPALQPRVRTLLAENGIWEGVYLQETLLDAARQSALAQSDAFGWVSLNFTGGCLAVETTQATYQTVQEDAPPAPLYAKADGEVVAVEPQSGFAVVTPGQPVEQGQLLVDTVRLDRDGDPVRQGVRGQIVARIEKSLCSSSSFCWGTACPPANSRHCRRRERAALNGCRCVWGGCACRRVCGARQSGCKKNSRCTTRRSRRRRWRGAAAGRSCTQTFRTR